MVKEIEITNNGFVTAVVINIQYIILPDEQYVEIDIDFVTED
jgi:hypothetical protein